MGIILVCVVAARGATAQEQGGQDFDLESYYILAVQRLHDPVELAASAQARHDRLKRALEYAQKHSRSEEISEEDRAIYKGDIEYLKEQIVVLSTYLKKDVVAYRQQVEKFLSDYAKTDRQVAVWEKARAAFWPKGEPRIRLTHAPVGKLPADSTLHMEVTGLPADAVVTWEARRGTIESSNPVDGVAKARWHARGSQSGSIWIRITHPTITFPMGFYVRVETEAREEYEGLPIVAEYREALSSLISLGLGMIQNREALAEWQAYRQEAATTSDDATAEPFEDSEIAIKEIEAALELQHRWAAYLDDYVLPFMAENDETEHAAAWEMQREILRKKAEQEGLRWPYHIRAGELMTSESWHYVVPDLPPETMVRWSLVDKNGHEQTKRGDSKSGVQISPHRASDETLVATLFIPGTTLPVRMEWLLPSNPAPQGK